MTPFLKNCCFIQCGLFWLINFFRELNHILRALNVKRIILGGVISSITSLCPFRVVLLLVNGAVISAFDNNLGAELVCFEGFCVKLNAIIIPL